MPDDPVTVRLFIAWPGDVTAERRSVDRAIGEVNTSLSAERGIRFEAVDWENNVHPALGTDGQEVINRQVADNYDAFLGIMWKRLGTPTPRASSGSIGEYERALTRRRETGGPEIMFYVKTAPVPHDVDTEQLQAVREFMSRVRNDGALTGAIRSPKNFENTLRIHLHLLTHRWPPLVQPQEVPRPELSSPSLSLGPLPTTISLAERLERFLSPPPISTR